VFFLICDIFMYVLEFEDLDFNSLILGVFKTCFIKLESVYDT
jgi:hypothetical protein